MSHVFKDLLQSNSPLFVQAIRQLERSAGNEGVDLRLIADITHKQHEVMRAMKLDPKDTTARELYLALCAYVEREDTHELLFDSDFVLARVGGEIVSLNYIDAVESAHHRLPFEQRILVHGQRSLRGEILARYTSHPRTHDATTRQLALDSGLIHGEFVTPVRINTLMSSTDNKEIVEQMDNNTPKLLAIGDIFTDAFITLGDETAKIIKEGDTEWLAVPFGQKPPYERVDIVKSVGPSPNVAVSMARLGCNAGLMAWVGGDATGEEAIEYLQGENVDIESMIVEQDKATSYWYVLCYKADRTMLVKSEKYRYEWRDPVTKPDWIYLAYLGEDSWPLHEGLLEYLERNPDIKFALQPGTFQFKWGTEKMANLYRRSHVALMNREEAMDVTGLPYDSIKNLAQGLHDLGPEIVVITDGPNGSYVSAEGKLLTIPNYPDPAPPLERTGAGDAFASTFVAAIADGESVETALAWAPINSMNVVQHVGAQAGLLSREEVKGYLASAPEWYKVTEFEG